MASSNYINECKNPAYENRLGKVVVGETEYNQGDCLTSIELEDNIYNNGALIGNTFTKSLKFSLIGVDKDTQFVGKVATPSIGVKYNNDTTEYIEFGDYTIENLNDEQTNNFTDITGYDALNKLDVEFDYKLDDTQSTEHTVLEYWNELLRNLGLETETLTFTNSDLVIPKNPFIGNETNRQVLSEIEKVSCTFSRCEKRTRVVDGVTENYHVVNLYWFDLDGEPIYEFDTDDYSSLDGSLTKYGPINSVILGNDEIGGENVVMEDDESIAQYGEHRIVINAEYFLFNEELREQAIQNIYDKLLGLEYYDLSLTTYYGKPFLNVGDKIRVNTNEENVYDTYILSHKFKFDGIFQSEISSPALTEQQELIKSTESVSSRLRRTELMVDKANQTITSIVESVEETNSNFSKITQTVDGLTIEVSSTQSDIEDLSNKIDETTSDVDGRISDVEASINNGVEKVQNSLVTIDSGGIHVATDGSEVQTEMNNEKFEIKSGETTLAYFGYDENINSTKAEMDNLTVTNYFVTGYHRFEKFDIDGEKRTGVFFIGGDE